MKRYVVVRPLLCLLCGHDSHEGRLCGSPGLGGIPWVCPCLSVPPYRSARRR